MFFSVGAGARAEGCGAEDCRVAGRRGAWVKEWPKGSMQLCSIYLRPKRVPIELL